MEKNKMKKKKMMKEKKKKKRKKRKKRRRLTKFSSHFRLFQARAFGFHVII